MSKLLPYETIVKAHEGDPDAIDTVLSHYAGYQQWLDGKSDKESLISAIKQADEECGSCGCELDPLYKRALELL